MNGVYANSITSNIFPYVKLAILSYLFIYLPFKNLAHRKEDYYRRYHIKPNTPNLFGLVSRASISGMCRNYLDSCVLVRGRLFTRSLNASVRSIEREKSKKIAVERVSPPGKFLQSYGDQGKVRDFLGHLIYLFRLSAAGCRDTTRPITDKVFTGVSTRYCSTEMAFVSDGTAPLSTAVNMSDLTGGVKNSARITYYPKIAREL